jgi:GTP-binding protein
MFRVSLVGRPNVGKSSLFNAITKTKKAIVSDFSGLTRDRQLYIVQYNDHELEFCDTGGLDFSNKEKLNLKIKEQALLSLDESDLILFVVDAKDGLTGSDEEINLILRKLNKPILLIINKSEGKKESDALSTFYKLGYKDILLTSSTHNQGIKNIFEYIELQFLTSELYRSEDDNSVNADRRIKLCVIGKPNVGKSTFINKIIGSDRLIAFDMPGTTVDSIEIDFDWKDLKLTLIDTAGIRRKGKVIQKEEKFSLLKSLENMNFSDIVIVMIDATEKITSQDVTLLTNCFNSYKPTILIINKWDLLDEYNKSQFNDALDKFQQKFSFIPPIKISALKAKNFNEIYKTLSLVNDISKTSLKTSIVNKVLIDALQNQQPPISKGIRPKIKFMNVTSTNPFTFVLHGNHLDEIAQTYKKYLEKYFRQAFKLDLVPIKLTFINASNPFNKRVKPIKTGLVTRRRAKNEFKKKMKAK